MRSSFARRLALTVLVPAALFGVVLVATPAQAAAPTTTRMQTDIAYWTNQHRAKAGCTKLRLDTGLARAARNHSANMARGGGFSHTGAGGSTFVARARAAGYNAALSENIAWGYRDGAAVVAAWMRSPGHRANIMNCKAKAVGVGAVYAANGTPYFTQDFGSRCVWGRPPPARRGHASASSATRALAVPRGEGASSFSAGRRGHRRCAGERGPSADQ